MALFVLKNSKIYVGGYDISGDLNKANISYKAEDKDITTFGSLAKRRKCGLTETDLKVSGFYQVDAENFKIDDILMSKFNAVDEVVTVFPQTGAVGEVGYSTKVMMAEYAPDGQVGDVFAFDMSAKSNDILTKITCMESGNKSVTGAGTGKQLGAVGANQKLYAVLHVLSVSGTNPTLNVKIISDDNASFTSATDRITFNKMTEIGAQWAVPLNGLITDDYWKVDFTIGGTNPVFNVVVGLAIQ